MVVNYTRKFLFQRHTLPLIRISEVCSSNQNYGKGTDGHSPSTNLRRGPDQRDLTNMDLLEERIRNRAAIREININGQTQKWNYRSEIVNKYGLDNSHRNIWVAYAIIIIIGFTSFVYVKSNVVQGRKEEMEERERIRRSLNLAGSDRKKIAIVDN
uniref:Uncharacterized protein n=1 Tax=Heterorhabditis bacteriophora TaxID=37862 RepID=A0A1I7XFD9_HETBA